MRSISMLCAATLALTAAPALAQAPAAAPAAPAKLSTTATKLSVLMGDSAARAILIKHIPPIAEVESAPNKDQLAGMTLKELKDASGALGEEVFTDKVMAAIDADLAKLPPK